LFETVSGMVAVGTDASAFVMVITANAVDTVMDKAATRAATAGLLRMGSPWSNGGFGGSFGEHSQQCESALRIRLPATLVNKCVNSKSCASYELTLEPS
jgi:hypothetical protein